MLTVVGAREKSRLQAVMPCADVCAGVDLAICPHPRKRPARSDQAISRTLTW